MFKILFILFLVIPLIEIAILIQIGQVIGAASTILLVIVTAAIGAGLFRQQGLSTLSRVQTQLDEGHLPAIELIEGVMLLLSGAMLLTPGFFTDVIGFLILVPQIRHRLASNLLSGFIATRIKTVHTGDSTIIEGEHWEIHERDSIDRDD